MNSVEIVGDGDLEAGGHLARDLGHQVAHALDDAERVGGRRGIDADEHRLQPVEHRRAVGRLRAERGGRHVADADQRVALRLDDELRKSLGRVERGAGVDRHRDQRALHLARGGDEIVGGERVAHVGRCHAQRRHAVRVEPDAHGKGLTAQDLRVGDPVDRLQLGLHDARDVVGDLSRAHPVGVERQIQQREALARLLGDDRVVRLARQHAAHLVDLGQHVGGGAVGIGVEPQIEHHRRGVGLRGRHQRVDALGRGHRLLDRGGDEPLDHVGAGAGIGRGDGDCCLRQLRELADRQVEQRDRAGHQDQKAHHGGEHRAADEDVGEAHRATRWEAVRAGGARPNCRSRHACRSRA